MSSALLQAAPPPCGTESPPPRPAAVPPQPASTFPLDGVVRSVEPWLHDVPSRREAMGWIRDEAALLLDSWLRRLAAATVVLDLYLRGPWRRSATTLAVRSGAYAGRTSG